MCSIISVPFLHNSLQQADERRRPRSSPAFNNPPPPSPPSIHHNQRQESAQLGPRNTQGHGLIVNTVKTQREEGEARWMSGDDGMLKAKGAEFEERRGGEEDGEGQIAAGPISSLMACK